MAALTTENELTVMLESGPRGRVAPDATAWVYRDALWGQVMVGVDPDPAKTAELRDWTMAYWEALHPDSMGGAGRTIPPA